MRGLFITATDTGAGKTFVTAGLARLWRRERRLFRVCKPAATGAENGWSEDTRRLAEAAGDPDLHALTPYTFAAAAAPPVAARLAGTALRLEDLAAAVRRRAAEGHAVLVEGVGGLLCPLTERETVADLAIELALPLIVVARRSLGTLNHTLLTVEAAQRRGLRLAGVVVTATKPVEGVAEETVIEELRQRLDVPLLAVLPYQPNAGGSEIAALQAVDWWRLADNTF
ncbi:MAG TPA: dethiobiotin synthase [Gemmataceae bacterium]|nr:dethiobiotin synthase [Gemmataceae bacterium]